MVVEDENGIGDEEERFWKAERVGGRVADGGFEESNHVVGQVAYGATGEARAGAGLEVGNACEFVTGEEGLEFAKRVGAFEGAGRIGRADGDAVAAALKENLGGGAYERVASALRAAVSGFEKEPVAGGGEFVECGDGCFVVGENLDPDGDSRTACCEGDEVWLEGQDGEGHGLFALFSVGIVWVEDGLFFGGDGFAFEGVFSEEAGLKAGVAGAAGLFDFEEEGVSITIGVPAEDFLGVTARFAFQPIFLAGPAPVVHEAIFQCGGEGGFVHPSHHEDPFGVGVLNDGRDESVGVVFEFGLHDWWPGWAGVKFGRWFVGRKERKGCLGGVGAGGVGGVVLG